MNCWNSIVNCWSLAVTYCLGSTFCQFTLPNTYHSLLDLFLTSFNLTRALKRVQVYLNYFHSTGTQQVAQTQLGWSYRKFRKVETRAIGISQKLSRMQRLLLFYISHFFKRKTDKETNKFHVSF